MRGNIYSRKNDVLDPYWNRYWEFSMNELSQDLAENIDFIREKSGSEKIGFVGHGHATTLLFMNMFNNPKEMEKRISSCIALAPVAHADYTRNAFYDYY